ncbi:cytochrome c oxidase subunit 8B [Salminus brasiliensis]|uniref:cytochrome c oxidase subunit 8B n=1 Tax=Salminus brasiliensis TaxID=930266 RepID=UPI003B83899A
MSMWSRSLSLLRAPLRHNVIQKAHITAKPPKHHLSTGEQVIAMTVMFATVLGPSGWILAHLEDYKKRP